MPRPEIRHIVVDVEGTTTPVSFVTSTLFPYARERLKEFVARHADSAGVQSTLSEARELMGSPDASNDSVVTELIRWIDEDRKATPLKTLQGLIWRAGYLSGELVAPVYSDVPDCLRRWKALGFGLHVYSSGSVEAQRLLFEHTNVGSLINLFDKHFDTRIGVKVEAASYLKIASELGSPPSACLFLTDSPAEVEAAQSAGWQVIRIDRELPDSDQISNVSGELVAGSFLSVDAWQAEMTPSPLGEREPHGDS